MTSALEHGQVEQWLATHSGWTLTREGKRIRKEFAVDNFLAGLEFFRHVAEIAEQMQHHPDLHIENYKDVWIEIWTHTVNGLTEKDFELAEKIDDLTSQVG